jgi:hypothetical protein
MSIRIGIIGSIGRTSDFSHVNRQNYAAMFAQVHTELSLAAAADPDITMVAGGGPFAEHLALAAYLSTELPSFQLEMHLPAGWDVEKKRFAGTKFSNTFNNLHERFSMVTTGHPARSLNTIATILTYSPTAITCHETCTARNEALANVDMLLAFTTGKTVPNSQIPRNVWTKATTAKKYHFDLRELTAP